jgi:hypothetical protein
MQFMGTSGSLSLLRVRNVVARNKQLHCFSIAYFKKTDGEERVPSVVYYNVNVLGLHSCEESYCGLLGCDIV